jgi:eukaryotic-like serine/threonine-protein kinase
VKQISRYEILSELGRGAMGVVFKAQDPLIGRLIALKTITASVADDPGLLERFRREAKAAGALQHPNIVTIYEMGESDGAPFIAMEYLEGESLAALIDRRAPIPLAQKVGYLVQTCRALQYAHRRGVIHRDIKPANIMVTLEGEVKVVDFGIARVADASKTQTGTLLGTLAYLSPQQIRGKGGNALSDIWSLGIVLYELLTGRRPFQGENHAALMLSIMHNDPVPLRELLAGCPPQLDAISRRALAKDETVRYQSMEELLLELKSAWAGLHLNRPGETPAEAARTGADDLALQLVGSRARTQVAPRAEKIGLRNLPARRAPSSAFPSTPKAASIPSVPIAATVVIPRPPSPGTANLASAMPVKARSGQRGIALAAIGLAVLAGIGLEANRVRVHYRTNPSLRVASNAQEAVPAAVNAIEDQPASSEKLTPDAQFNAALAHFHRAVVAKDAGSLKLLVRPEFQRIAQEGGPRAKDAAAYVSSAIPIALRGMTPWPQIRCGGEPDQETALQLSSFVDCAWLDPPKPQWVQFSWPEFPPQARQAGLDNGLAMLSLTVDQEGAVVGAWSRVKPDSFGFTSSAMKAALKWKTTVPRATGNPVETQLSVDVPFSQ